MITTTRATIRDYWEWRIAPPLPDELTGPEEKRWKENAERYIVPYIGECMILDVGYNDVMRCIYAAEQGGGFEAAYLTRKILKRIFDSLQENRLIGRFNPMNETCDLNNPRRTGRFFTKREEEDIYAVSLRIPYGEVVQINLLYGLPIRSILALETNDLETTAGYVNIRRTLEAEHRVHSLDARNWQHFPVDPAGMVLFREAAAHPCSLSASRRLQQKVRYETKIQDYSYEIGVRSFMLRQFREHGMLPPDLKFYYGSDSANFYFDFIDDYLGDVPWEEKIALSSDGDA